jgi:hypothetical protein
MRRFRLVFHPSGHQNAQFRDTADIADTANQGLPFAAFMHLVSETCVCFGPSWWQHFMERVHLEELGLDLKIILKWIYKKLDGKAWAGLIWIGNGQVAGDCECRNEPSGSIKCGKILDRGTISFLGGTLFHGVSWGYLVGHLWREIGLPKAYICAEQRKHKRIYYIYSLS